MPDQVNAAAVAAPVDGVVLLPEVLEAVVRAVAAGLAPQRSQLPGRSAGKDAGPSPLLTVKQAAALMGVSRMTVIRLADAGELPCVVVCRGARQKLRRFPRAPIEELAARGGAGALVDLKEFTAQWLASIAAQAGSQVPAVARGSAAEVA
jgi:excisionase family DNA binding protein